VSVGGDDDHRVIVWDWRTAATDAKGCVLAEDKIGRNKVFDIGCNPFNLASACSFVTVGSKHVKFWDLEPDKGGYKLKKGGGTTDSYAVSVDFIEKTSLDPQPEAGEKNKGYALTGAFESGQIVIWKGDGKRKLGAIAVGKETISILSSAVSEYGLVLTGDSEGLVSVWAAESFGKPKP
jgi:WD40 repeat protein